MEYYRGKISPEATDKLRSGLVDGTKVLESFSVENQAMPQEFRALIRETHDTSRRIDVTDMRTGEEKQEEMQKGATFILESFGPCPWPPQQLAGKVVRVIIED